MKPAMHAAAWYRDRDARPARVWRVKVQSLHPGRNLGAYGVSKRSGNGVHCIRASSAAGCRGAEESMNSGAMENPYASCRSSRG